MSSLKRVGCSIVECKKRLKELSIRQEELRKKDKLTCGGCHISSEISGWTFLQAVSYVPPRGCIEGDFLQREDLSSHVVCPSCGVHCRVDTQDFFRNICPLMIQGENFRI